LTSKDVTAARIENLARVEREDSAAGGLLEKVFGVDRFKTLQWWRTGLKRCRAVVRIDDLNGVGRGTGFLIEGSALHPSLPPLVVITNAHVVPDAIEPTDAVVAFHGLDADEAGSKEFNVRTVCWSSPPSPPGVDTTVLELDGLPDKVEPIPLVDTVRFTDDSRAYIIGHPRGYDQPQFSIQDNKMLDHDDTHLHYRSPTEGGSSGSPVFESQWKVIGLHHAGSVTMSRLEGKGTYPANEALRIDAIRTAIGAYRK
jgi:V8-like Glu-specific endopeptidase